MTEYWPSRAELTPVTAAMSEDELLGNVVLAAQLRGWLVYHIRNSKRGVVQGNPGFPDLIMVRDGRLLAVELKRQDKHPTPDQRMWLERLAAAGAFAVVWHPADWTTGLIDQTLD